MLHNFEKDEQIKKVIILKLRKLLEKGAVFQQVVFSLSSWPFVDERLLLKIKSEIYERTSCPLSDLPGG